MLTKLQNADGIDLGLKPAFGDIQLTEELIYQVLCLEYFFNCTFERSNKLSFRCFVIILDCFHETDVAQHMFICFPDHTGIYSSLVKPTYHLFLSVIYR